MNSEQAKTSIGTNATEEKAGHLSLGTVLRRIGLSLGTTLIFLIIALFVLLATIAHGPSQTIRDTLVLSAMQASATKWVPGLFLDQELVDQIVQDSLSSDKTSVDINDFHQHYVYETTPDGEVIVVPVQPGTNPDQIQKDEWEGAIDGMRYFTMSGTTYKAYILLVKDPSRVYVGTSSDFKSGKTGIRVFDIASRENCVAVINGGEFNDENGVGTGDTPIGLTYSKGNCVWNDGKKTNFIGIDENNNLVVKHTLTKEEAEELKIRDGVSFQTGNVLIDHSGDKVNLYYSGGNTGLAQRTAIGQRADGTMILVVTDGRTASALGATHDDIINLMVQLGAVTAGMLDGGSSAMMYYEDYYDKYNMNKDLLDSYQLQGLVNKYKAFTRPRRIPTFFCVRPLAD